MRSFLLFLLAIVSVLACFAIGFSWRDIRQGEVPTIATLQSAVNLDGSRSAASPNQIFRSAYGQIAASYYKPLEEQKLKHEAMKGLLASLGDPHTMFLEPRLAKEFALETGGNFVGVGARLSGDSLGARAVAVFEDGPAFRAGMRRGDLITAVDGQPMAGKRIDDIVSSIRGKEGTTVRLQLMRKDHEKPIEITVRRAPIVTPTVESDMIGGDVGYISISQFSEPTPKQFEQALKEISQRNPDGLIIDVRSNPGGLLEAAVEMLSKFVEDKVLVKMKMRNQREEVARAYVGHKRNFNYPVVVLINDDSASAAEIFAGVLQDYALATLVGSHTYGKASVQNLFPLADGSSAKITIARYYIPSGRDISRKVDEEGTYLSGGLEPDVKVEFDPASISDIDSDKLPMDNQMQKALEIIRSKNGSQISVRRDQGLPFVSGAVVTAWRADVRTV